MSTQFDLANPGRTLHVGVILMKGETEILDVAPIDLLHGITKKFVASFPKDMIPDHLLAQALDVDFHWVNETGEPARLTAGITMKVTDTFTTCPPLDVVLMGAHDMGYTPNEAELNFVRKSYDDCSAFLTICGGFQAAMMAGLLKGKSATAPRNFLSNLKSIAPETDWVEKRWHRDGKIWTSGALLNGLDLMRAFGVETWGSEGSLMELIVGIGSWPVRDVTYANEPRMM